MTVGVQHRRRAPWNIERRSSVFAFWSAALALLAGCASVAAEEGPARSAAGGADFGVLVMAHGGDEAWNREVAAALAPRGEDYPLEIAFGMADAASLQEGVSKLEAEGVRRIAVVRLFISGESWRERTEQILGLAPGAPERPAGDMNKKEDGHGRHRMEFWRVDTNAVFALSKEGLADAPEMEAVLVERARGLSRDPAGESVLILAHGPGDDAENQRWLEKIDARAQAVRAAEPFRDVRVETLREDWPEKRKAAAARIRAFVEAAGEDGGRVIVIPYRVQGFGPYAEVLAGLDYAADGKGLTPHRQVGRWVRRQVEEMAAGPFRAPMGSRNAALAAE